MNGRVEVSTARMKIIPLAVEIDALFLIRVRFQRQIANFEKSRDLSMASIETA